MLATALRTDSSIVLNTATVTSAYDEGVVLRVELAISRLRRESPDLGAGVVSVLLMAIRVPMMLRTSSLTLM